MARRFLFLVAALVLVAGTASAGDYHTGVNLVCSDCHVMHASETHDYAGNAFTPPGWWAPTEFLLKGPENELCLSCHDENSGYPDVFAANGGQARTTGRSAGALNGVTQIAGYYDYMGHTLGATNTAPGGAGSFVPDPVEGLKCTDCHHQHGFAGSSATDVAGNAVTNAYRILKGLGTPAKNVSYAVTTNDTTKDVFEAFPNDYEQDGVNLNEPVATDSGFGTWCTKCHVNFHGAVGDTNSIGGVPAPVFGYEEFIRHPNATVNIGEVLVTATSSSGHSSATTFTGTLYRVRVMSPTGDWGPVGSAWTHTTKDLTPTCLSCHKAHGSNHSFGLIYALGNAPLGEDGDGTSARHLCRQCHGQGAD